jgi:hypothetical protein
MPDAELRPRAGNERAIVIAKWIYRKKGESRVNLSPAIRAENINGGLS